MTIGKVLRNKRNSNKGTLEDYSKKLNISRQFLGEIEKETRKFTINRFDDIVNVYGFSENEKAALALHLANHGRINEQTRKYLKVEIKRLYL